MTQQSGTHREFYEREFRGYVKLQGPVPAATRFQPLQANRQATIQEWPQDRGGYAGFLTPPIAFGAVQAVTPKQATRQATLQEWPGYHPPATALGPTPPVSAVRPLQATVAKIPQEQPWHPPPWAAGPFPVSRFLPLQSARAQTTQEQPGHPLPWTAAPFPVSAVLPLQAIKAQIVQEQPWHPPPWAGAPFPVSRFLPLQSIRAQITQELPWHPMPRVSAPYASTPIASFVVQPQARTIQEWPGWHPSPWTVASLPVGVLPANLPSYFSLGLISGIDVSWLTGSGVPWNFIYAYLGATWETFNSPTGQFASLYAQTANANGYIPTFTWYLAGGSNVGAAVLTWIQNTTNMADYYTQFVLMLQKAANWQNFNNATTTGAHIVLSADNTTASYTGASGTDVMVIGGTYHSSGKWVVRFHIVAQGGTNIEFGIGTSSTLLGPYLGQTTASAGILGNGTGLLINDIVVNAQPALTYANGDDVDVAVDLDNKLLWARKNLGNWNGNASFSPGGTGGVDISALSFPNSFTFATNLHFSGDQIVLTTPPAIVGFSAWKSGTPVGAAVAHIEPDLWGYMQQQGGPSSAQTDDPTQVPVSVASSGYPGLSTFANNAAGFAQALKYLRDTYAPNISLAWHASRWAKNNAYNPASSTTLLAMQTGVFLSTFYSALGTSFDLIFHDTSDRDSAYTPANSPTNDWWNGTAFENFRQYLLSMFSATGRKNILWQTPVGNTLYKTCANVANHYQDDRAEFFLTHAPTAQSPLYSGSNIPNYINAGVVALLFGKGQATDTSYKDEAGDGITNPAPISGNPVNGSQNTATALLSDDDGGFLRLASADYYVSPVSLTGSAAPLISATARITQELPWHPGPRTFAPFPVTRFLPLQSAKAQITQEQPWHPMPWATSPFPVSAVLPLQGENAQTTQEWPWHPLPWVTAALIPPLVPIRMQGRVLFEWPWHPLPWAAAPFPVSRALPLQGVRAQIVQEWPTHPLPWTLGSFVPFVQPGAFVLQPQIRTTQEQPWHPSSWTRAPFPASRFLPLQSATAQIMQEQPWHPNPVPLTRPPFPVTRFLPLQSARAFITQEWPWHPAAWASGLFQVPIVPLLKSVRAQVSQEWPGFHPTATLGAPPPVIPPLQSASASFAQEWPGWHPLPALPPGLVPKIITAPFPLPGVSITTLEWPGYHPRPFLLPSYNYVPGPLVFPPRPGYVPAPYGPTTPFSATDIASAQWVRKAIDVLNNILAGKLNVGLSFSLNTGVSTTTIIDARISAFSALLLTPLTANAAAIRPSIYVSSQTTGQATLTHSVTVNADCGFTLTILG